MAGPHSGGFLPRSSLRIGAAAGTREQLAAPVTVTLPLSTWLILQGWALAHLTADATPAIIEDTLSQIERQVIS
jgi:hypothetical protein